MRTTNGIGAADQVAPRPNPPAIRRREQPARSAARTRSEAQREPFHTSDASALPATRQRFRIRTAARTPGLASLVASSFLNAALLGAEPPRIDRIEFFLTDQVTVHFDTEANRTYELQFRNDLKPSSDSQWTNLFIAPRLPFPNHYIVVDTRTNQARVYRLRVTP